VGVPLPNKEEPADPKAGAVNPVVAVLPKVCPNGLAVAPLLKPPPPVQQFTLCTTIYIGHFRRSVYDFIVITKYDTTLLIFQDVETYIPYTM